MQTLQADLAAQATAFLRSTFRYKSFRPHQLELVVAALQNRDVLGVLPTGAGKSLTFQLPALMRTGLTICVSPLVALMEDQVRQLAASGIGQAACLNNLTSEKQWEGIREQIKQGSLRLLYVAPERLTTQRFADALQQTQLTMLVVDEAHCVSEWGHNFRPEYRRIRDFRQRMENPPTLALTATATPQVRQDIVTNLGLSQPQIVIGDFDRPNLFWNVRQVKFEARRYYLIKMLSGLTKGSAIVYTPSRKLADDLAEFFQAEGLRAGSYHAGMPPQKRQQSQAAFLEGETQIMCATIAFGMGVHKHDVRHVIHLKMPRSLEAYYQEAGRAGRDGGHAQCTLLYHEDDADYYRKQIEAGYPDATRLRELQLAAIQGRLREIEEAWKSPDLFALALSALTETGYLAGNPLEGFHSPSRRGDRGAQALKWLANHQNAELKRLAYMERYAQSADCRSSILVGYFGQELPRCGHCDRCLESRSRGRVIVPAHATPSNQAAYDDCAEALRTWRNELAEEWGTAPFVIFNNKTLERIAEQLPTQKSEFLAVPGLGPKKWESFGEELLAFIRELLAAAHR